MNELDFSFEQSPWEAFLSARRPGAVISAANLLALLEGEEQQEVEAAFLALETADMSLDISGLPKGGMGEASLRLRQETQLVKNGLNPKELEPNDPLRLYLEEVADTPAFGDEQALAERCARGDEQAMLALTHLGLRRVVELAKTHVGYGVLLLDLIQEGSLGLWQAIRSFRGGGYAPYRDRWIRLYLAKAVTLQARADGVGRKLRTALEDYRAADERLLCDLGRNPTLEEIALQMHMSVEEASAVRKMLDDARLLAQASKAPDPEAQSEEAQQAVEDTAQFQSRARILDLLSSLSEEDARLLTLRFGLEGSRPMTPEEAGRNLGLTPEEVLDREASALAKLRSES